MDKKRRIHLWWEVPKGIVLAVVGFCHEIFPYLKMPLFCLHAWYYDFMSRLWPT